MNKKVITKTDIQEFLKSKLLENVEKPGRYIGKEYNEVVKEEQNSLIKVALAFPDLYEIGMSYLGYKILYEIINKRVDAAAERVFLPAKDMEILMKKEDIPLFSLENYRLLTDFNIIGFSLQHELCYTNVLHTLYLGNLPLHSADRDESFPLIIAGGPSAFNPEPLADFIDLFVIGDGEDVIGEIIDVYQQWANKTKSKTKYDLLLSLSKLKGIYIPSFYKVNYKEDGTIDSFQKKVAEIDLPVKKRITLDLNKAPYPDFPIVPNIDVVHNRITLEIFRGCTRGCRFCQAGIIYRPIRERSAKTIFAMAENSLKNTGYDEVSLSSLSSSDHSCISQITDTLVNCYKDIGVAVSLPSLRIDSFSVQLARQTQQVRKTGLTFAPEVGTKRMSNVINKNVSEDDLYQTVQDALKEGWQRIKLYFMIGLPTETWNDIDGIIDIIKKVEAIGKQKKGKRFTLSVSINSFIPKAHTPFQWVTQENEKSLQEKFAYIADRLRNKKNISYSFPDTELSVLESVFARGDRRLGLVIEDAYTLGCKFDTWREFFDFNKWEQAFQKNNIMVDFYTYRERSKEEILPWDLIDCGVNKSFLWSEWEKASQEITTDDCRNASCHNCGLQEICSSFKKANIKKELS